jgi:uncharacterized protein YabE (DUF348 family)
MGRSVIKHLFFYKKDFLLLFLAFFLATYLGAIGFGMVTYYVVIEDGKHVIQVTTTSRNPKKVIEKKGFHLGEHDQFVLASGEGFEQGILNKIQIQRAISMKVLADGAEHMIHTTQKTIKDAINHSFIHLGDKDRVLEADIEDGVVEGMRISLVRVDEIEEIMESPVEYDTIRRESEELAKGEEKVLREGQEGLSKKVFNVILENGEEVSRNLFKELVITPPVNKIVGYGGNDSYRTSRGGVIRAKEVIRMSATSYSSSYRHTGKTPDHPYYGITATGVRAREGIVAVDPNVIPLGSKLYVELEEGIPDYGFAIAADTGGAVKGNIIDLYFDDEDRISAFGRRRAKVYILEN